MPDDTTLTVAELLNLYRKALIDGGMLPDDARNIVFDAARNLHQGTRPILPLVPIAGGDA